MRIVTTNEVHILLNWFDLTKEEQSDYEDDEDSSFFRHDNSCYSLGDILRTKNNPWVGKLPEEYNDWEGMHVDTPIVIKIVHGIDDGVIVGLVLSD